jgi:hypothetical protein
MNATRELVGEPRPGYQRVEDDSGAHFVAVVSDQRGDWWYCAHRHPTVRAAQGCATFAIVRYRREGRLSLPGPFGIGDLVQIGSQWREVVGLRHSGRRQAGWLQVGPIGGGRPWGWIRAGEVAGHLALSRTEQAVSELMGQAGAGRPGAQEA